MAPGIQGPLRITTPGKVTLALQILRRRSDGYHDIRLLLAPVSLYDTLAFAPGAGAGVTLAGADEAALGPPERNLVVRAAHAFAEAAGVAPALAVTLQKRIPAAAGLGGGSGNAAGTLLALNRLHGEPLDAAALHALAAGLGSDVPFFLHPRPALAEGRGERLTPLQRFPSLPLLVVRPALAVSTGEAYVLAQPRAGRPHPLAGHAEGPPDLPAVLSLLENDFEAALFPRWPELLAVKEALLAAGAAGAVLSGSGSAVAGLFADTAARDEAAARLSGRRDWQLLPCRTLAGHDCFAEPPQA